MNALRTERFQDFENLTLGGAVPLVDPQAGIAYDLEGTDSHQLKLDPPPALASEQKAGEAVELYWMALMRDVPFSQYGTNKLAGDACRELNSVKFHRRLDGVKETVTPATLFRGFTDGDVKGPYVSQFLYQTLEFGAAEIVQRFQTLLPLSAGGADWMTDFSSWLAVQNGQGPDALAWKTPSGTPNRIDPVRRYLRQGRDICQYVHIDVLFEAYFNACLFLIDNGAPFNPANPYIGSKTQTGFGTFGSPHVMFYRPPRPPAARALLAEVATRALKAVWYQKWLAPRQPQRFASDAACISGGLPAASFVWPGAWNGGGRAHDYCEGVFRRDVEDSESAGRRRRRAESDAVHGQWRTDYSQALLLGEQVAIGILQDQLATFSELPQLEKTGWCFKGFRNETIEVLPCPRAGQR